MDNNIIYAACWALGTIFFVGAIVYGKNSSSKGKKGFSSESHHRSYIRAGVGPYRHR